MMLVEIYFVRGKTIVDWLIDRNHGNPTHTVVQVGDTVYTFGAGGLCEVSLKDAIYHWQPLWKYTVNIDSHVSRVYLNKEYTDNFTWLTGHSEDDQDAYYLLCEVGYWMDVFTYDKNLWIEFLSKALTGVGISCTALPLIVLSTLDFHNKDLPGCLYVPVRRNFKHYYAEFSKTLRNSDLDSLDTLLQHCNTWHNIMWGE